MTNKRLFHVNTFNYWLPDSSETSRDMERMHESFAWSVTTAFMYKHLVKDSALGGGRAGGLGNCLTGDDFSLCKETLRV